MGELNRYAMVKWEHFIKRRCLNGKILKRRCLNENFFLKAMFNLENFVKRRYLNGKIKQKRDGSKDNYKKRSKKQVCFGWTK